MKFAYNLFLLAFPIGASLAFQWDESCDDSYPATDMEKCCDHGDGSGLRRFLSQMEGDIDRGTSPAQSQNLRGLLASFIVNDEPLATNFVISSTQAQCFTSCGAFGPAFKGLAHYGFSPPVDDINDDDDDYHYNGYDGSGGTNYLTSTNTEPFCPSSIQFDYSLNFQNLGGAFTQSRTVHLEVLDADDVVIFSKEIPQLRLDPPFNSGERVSRQGSVDVDLQGPGFNGCCPGGKLRFAFRVPQWFTGPAGVVLDNVIVAPLTNVGIDGDPHVKTWNGQWFDYMGECDLELVHAPNFDGTGKDLSIHVRTTIRRDYSYIEAAAIRIGTEEAGDVLEVASFGDYAVNGVDTPALGENNGMLDGYDIHYTQINKKRHKFDIVLGSGENITVSTYKDMVAVHIGGGAQSAKYFGKSTGIMGDFKGTLLARDGVTIMDDMNAFGQEWQVTDKQPMLFRSARHPQYPQKCILPSPTAAGQRRLGATISEEAAEKACAHLSGGAFENCVHDVMAIGDLELAEAAGAF